MRLNLMLEIDIEAFQSKDPQVLEYPEDVRDTLVSHFDSISHLLGETEPTEFFGYITDDDTGFKVSLVERDFEK